MIKTMMKQSKITRLEVITMGCSTWMTIIVPTSTTTYLYLYSPGEVSLASQPVYYLPCCLVASTFTILEVRLCIAIAILLIFPFDTFYLSFRYFLLRTLWRIALCCRQAITFPDFFLADILTFMAKKGDEKDKAYQRERTILNFNLVLHESTAYCGFSRIFKFNKPNCCSNLLHGRRWIYYGVIGINLILRCTRTYKLTAHLLHNYLNVFTVSILEILRRFQWVFFRVENEWNKITKSSFQVEVPKEDEKLLVSTNHKV